MCGDRAEKIHAGQQAPPARILHLSDVAQIIFAVNLNLPAFLQRHFGRKPLIEASILGVWQLERIRRVDCSGEESLVYVRSQNDPTPICLEVARDWASFFAEYADSPRTTDGRVRLPYRFDPASGTLRIDEAYYFVARVSEQDMMLFDPSGLEMGCILRRYYVRVK